MRIYRKSVLPRKSPVYVMLQTTLVHLRAQHLALWLAVGHSTVFKTCAVCSFKLRKSGNDSFLDFSRNARHVWLRIANIHHTFSQPTCLVTCFHVRVLIGWMRAVRHVLRMLQNLVDERADPDANVAGNQMFEAEMCQATLHCHTSLTRKKEYNCLFVTSQAKVNMNIGEE